MNTVQEGPPRPASLDSIFRSQHTDNRQHSVLDFLERPQLLLESSWDSSLRRNQALFPSFDVPEVFLKHPMFNEKLQGFTSFRATAVITVQFQSQPFQCGRALITSIPLPTLTATRQKFISDDVARMMLLNHVQCDIAKQTEVTLRIPFVSPYNSYDLVSKNYSWARVHGAVYSMLNQVGNVPIDIIVYGHFEEIQLGAPTSGKIAQSGEEPPTFSDFRQRAKESGLTSGNFSRVTGALTNTVNALGDYLPSLRKGTNFVSQGLLKPLDNIVGPILALLGFSKPISTMQAPTCLRPASVFATTDGTDMSQPLSLMEMTNVPYIGKIDGSKKDEMSFDFLKKIPQYISDFEYSSTSDKGEVLWQIPVRPISTLQKSIRVTKFNLNQTLEQPTHLSYITSPFKYWSGGLIYTFKFIKTDYHSGRVEFSFHPFSDYIDNESISDYCYRMIIDLREKSEVSFKVPFISPAPNKRLMPSDSTSYSSEPNASLGTLVCRSLTALKSASTIVSSRIEVLVEINAADDFYVSCPIETTWLPFDFQNAKIAQSGASGSEQENMRSVAIEHDPPSIAMRSDHNPTLDVVVSGEKFLNFRNFIKRATYTDKWSDTSIVAFDPHIYIRPPKISFVTYREDTTTEDAAAKIKNLGVRFTGHYPTPLSYVSAMYALYRGGCRLKVYAPQSAMVSARLRSYYHKRDNTPNYHTTMPLAIEQRSIKTIAEFQIPYYAPCLTSPISEVWEGFYYSYPRNEVEVGCTASGPIYVAVSAADDMDFSVFLGTPPCISIMLAHELAIDDKEQTRTLTFHDYDPFLAPVSNPVPQDVSVLTDLDLVSTS